MDTYLKAIAAVFITVVLCLLLNKHGKDFSLLLTLIVCSMILTACVFYLRPVFELILKLSDLGHLNNQMMSILLKSVGVALLAEISQLVCTDAGNSTLGKAINFLSISVILWLSIPLINSLLDLFESIFLNT